ncbi:MAG: SIS domain-containing protein [Candidatus Peribacteraceae bacterium]|nr:SIS domain-containing protein [Candidatus Peribacteraceae bacterium]MDD5075200.1 SIS domain-containing protein [Candidatus Peribacteraceae bacterium]
MFPSITAILKQEITEAVSLHSELEKLAPALEAAATHCANALRNGGKIVLFGNGGSAADSQHIAAEFVGRFDRERDPLPAISLTTNTSVLTAVGNDYAFSTIFERQVRALVTGKDVVIGFSTSGDSENVLKGMKAAKALGAKTIGFSGSGGALKSLVQVSLAVPSTHTPRIQEAHIFLGHILTLAVENMLAEGKAGAGGASPAIHL